MMNAELSDLIAELENNSADARAKFGGLSSEQLNWKPSTESWSVGQCFDHLEVSSREMISTMEELTGGSHKTTFFERVPFWPKFIGGFLVKAVSPETARKIKNPKIFDPAQSDVPVDVIERFLMQQDRAAAVMRASENIDVEKTIMTSPVAKFVTYSLLDGFRVIVYHGKRHMLQAERVTAAEGFPR